MKQSPLQPAEIRWLREDLRRNFLKQRYFAIFQNIELEGPEAIYTAEIVTPLGRRFAITPDCESEEKAMEAATKLLEDILDQLFSTQPPGTTELNQLIAMLDRSGIGYGKRHEFDTKEYRIDIEAEDGMISDFEFSANGNLLSINAYPYEEG